MLRTLTLLAALLVAAPVFAQQVEGPVEIFRYANFGAGWTVTLGQPLNVPPNLLKNGSVVREGPGIYTLGFYERFEYGSVAIRVRISTDADGDVASLRFDYGLGYRFDVEREDYEELLGTPVREERSADGETATWEDGQTRFELIREATPDGDQWHSELSEAMSRL